MSDSILLNEHLDMGGREHGTDKLIHQSTENTTELMYEFPA
jgi:hypothetical protein